jgi:hypothetical protein
MDDLCNGPPRYLFQSIMLWSTVRISRPLGSASFLTASRGGARLARGERRLDVLGTRALGTWTPQTARRVPQAHRFLSAHSGERWRCLARGVPAVSGAGVTRRVVVVQPPAQVPPSPGVGHRVQRVSTLCSTMSRKTGCQEALLHCRTRCRRRPTHVRCADRPRRVRWCPMSPRRVRRPGQVQPSGVETRHRSCPRYGRLGSGRTGAPQGRDRRRLGAEAVR